eukprot:995541-Ditylum_brightwellii.AAC.1
MVHAVQQNIQLQQQFEEIQQSMLKLQEQLEQVKQPSQQQMAYRHQECTPSYYQQQPFWNVINQYCQCNPGYGHDNYDNYNCNHCKIIYCSTHGQCNCPGKDCESKMDGHKGNATLYNKME